MQIQFGQSTLVLQGARHKPTADQVVQFVYHPGTDLAVAVEGDQVKITAKGPKPEDVAQNMKDEGFDPERVTISGLVLMLKTSGVPLSSMSLESEDRPDVVTEFAGLKDALQKPSQW